MPQSLQDVEYATRYGALDEVAGGVGEFVHPHCLRELARSTNRLAVKGQYLMAQTWNGNGSDDESRGARLFTPPPVWQRVHLNARVPHKGFLRRADLRMRARIDADDTVLFQFVTGGHVLRTDIRAGGVHPNIIACHGTGSPELYSSDELVLGQEDFEAIEVWCSGDATSNLLDESQYGANAEGTPTTVFNNGLLDDTSSWDYVTLNGIIGQHVVQLFNADGFALTSPLRFYMASPTELMFDGHRLTREQTLACLAPGVTYSIFGLSRVRLLSCVVRERDGWRDP